MRDKIEEILKNEFGISAEVIKTVTDDTDLLESEILDSFDFVQFLMFLDEIYAFNFWNAKHVYFGLRIDIVKK